MFHVYAEAISWMDGWIWWLWLELCSTNLNKYFFFLILLCPYIHHLCEIKVRKKKQNAKEVLHTSLKDRLTIYCWVFCCCFAPYCYEGVQLRPLTGEKYVLYFFFSLRTHDGWWLKATQHIPYTQKKKSVSIYQLKEKNVIQQLIWTPFGSRHKLAPRNIQCSF